MFKNCGVVKVMLKKRGQVKVVRNDNKQELSLLMEHIFPPKITRRDALTLFSGFEKNANHKILGAFVHLFKRHKI